MGVVPRKFFCGECKRDRWPGSCAHGRVVSELSGMTLVQRQLLFDDVCRGCGESPRGCNCPADVRRDRSKVLANGVALHVLALVGCSCKHHVTAYLADDVAGTIACGKCCSGLTVGKGLTFPIGEVRVVKDEIDNSDRISVSMYRVEKAIEYALLSDSNRELIRDEQLPGWVCNGHFLAYVGVEEAKGLFARYKTRDFSILDRVRGWEAAGPGQRVTYGTVNCEPKDSPVEMMAWGRPGWTYERPRPTMTIVAPAYGDVVMSGTICREKGHDDEALAMLIGWDGPKIRAIIMPRQETIIW